MQIERIRESKLGRVFEIPQDLVLTESDYHRIIAEGKTRGIELLKEDKVIGFVIQGSVQVLADAIIHTKQGAKGETIRKTVIDSVLILEQSQCTALTTKFREITNETEKTTSLALAEEIKSKLPKEHFSHCHLDSSLEPKAVFLMNVATPRFILCLTDHELVIINDKHILVRDGEQELVDVDGNKSKVSVSGKKENIDIDGSCIHICGKSIGQIVSEAIDKAMNCK